MKNRVLVALIVSVVFALPAFAQTGSTSQDQPAASQPTQTAPAQSATTASSSTDQSSSMSSSQTVGATGKQPLQPETRQGFWGKVNPFARKKYVQRQTQPIRDRVNELDELTASNSKMIKDVDSRAQQGIQLASAKANEADQHAMDAGNRAQAAQDTATQANTRLSTVEQVVGNIDQYKPASQTEIRFHSGHTVLGTSSKQALDDMTANLKDSKGYIIEVQGFSASGGQAGVQSSQAMANSVVRYLVEKNEIPVYRIFVMGMGNAKVPPPEGSTAKARGNRVEISLLKNDVDQLASAQSNGQMSSSGMSSYGNNPTGYSHPENSPTTQTQQQPSNMNSAPSNTTPPQQQ